jgi:anaerobic C4-dicarboxylate transporter
MARGLRPLADREAMLALGLAGAGFLSLGATLPAAGALAVRSFRTQRVADGTGPAFGVLVLGVAWISFLLAYPTMRAMWLTASEHHDPLRVAAFLAGWCVLALSAILLANFLCRCHPERVTARAAARAGLVAVIAAGLLQLMAVTDAMLGNASRECGESLADCIGAPPWASFGPALAIGLAWLGLSTAATGLARLRRRRRVGSIERPPDGGWRPPP